MVNILNLFDGILNYILSIGNKISSIPILGIIALISVVGEVIIFIMKHLF